MSISLTLNQQEIHRAAMLVINEMSSLKGRLHGANKGSGKSLLMKWQLKTPLKEFTRGRKAL